MSARFEVCRGDGGWWARFRAANGRVVWWTENYGRRRDAVASVVLITGHVIKPNEAGEPSVSRACRGEDIEVRDVDERTKP